MKTLLLVEGGDEVYLLRHLLKPMATHGIVIEEVKGKDKFRSVILTLQQRPEFATKQFNVLGFIRDADESRESAHQSLADSLREAGFSVPAVPQEFADGEIRTITFIIAKPDGTGMLEDLCLSSVADKDGFECLDAFFGCAQEKGMNPKNLSKARVRAWLSLQHKWDLSVGEAVKEQIWSFDNPVFDDLKEFLRKIAQDAKDHI